MKDPLAYINAIKEILNETDNVDDIGPGPTNRSKIPRLDVMPNNYNLEERGSGIFIDPRGLQDGKIPLPAQELNEGGIATPKRGFVDEPGSYAGRKVSEERLKFLNEAAEKYGYKDFKSVEGRDNRINVAKDATRREKGVSEGKGRPGVKKDYQVKTGEKDLASDAYLQRDLKRTKNQESILKAIQSGEYKTAEEIRKFTKLNKPNFNKEVKNLFKNVYTQIGDLNKPKKSQRRFGVRFLPRDLDQLYEIRSQLGQIEGFESTEQRTIYKTIEEAYGQKGKNPNRKAFAEATKKASDFSRIKNQINKKYPSINLELEHPLDYKTIKGLGKEGEKFLYVTPVDRSINRGFKATLGDAYAKAIQNKDKNAILKIEKLADDMGVIVGKVRGNKVMDYGTGPLRNTDLGSEIINNLRQQNVIADNIKALEKSGELKTRLKDIGLTRAGEKNYKINKVSETKIKNILKIIGCGTGKSSGGRIGFQDGATCERKGVDKVNKGNLKDGSEMKNFSKLVNTTGAKTVQGVLKTLGALGVAGEAGLIGIESAVRMGMGDTFSEAIKRSTDYLIPGDQTLSADMDKISRELDPGLAKLYGNVQNYYNKQQKLKSFENQKAELKNLKGSEFDYLPDSSEFDSAINIAKKDLASSTITSEDELVAQRALDESYDSSKAKSFFSNQRLKARQMGGIGEDVSGMQIDLRGIEAKPERETFENFEEVLSMTEPEMYDNLIKLYNAGEFGTPGSKEADAKAQDEYDKAYKYLAETKKAPLSQNAQEFGLEQVYGFNPIKSLKKIDKPMPYKRQSSYIPSPQQEMDMEKFIEEQARLGAAGGGLAKLAGQRFGKPPEAGPTPQGLASILKRDR